MRHGGKAWTTSSDGDREGCVYRISDSTVLVVKAAKDRSRCNDAEALDDARRMRQPLAAPADYSGILKPDLMQQESDNGIGAE